VWGKPPSTHPAPPTHARVSAGSGLDCAFGGENAPQNDLDRPAYPHKAHVSAWQILPSTQHTQSPGVENPGSQNDFGCPVCGVVSSFEFGFRVLSFGFRVSSFGFRVSTPNTAHTIQPERLAPPSGIKEYQKLLFRVSNFGFRVSTPNAAHAIQLERLGPPSLPPHSGRRDVVTLPPGIP